MPTWMYNGTHLPVAWFGANRSGYENEAQMKQLVRYDLVTFGWQAFLDKSNFTHEAQDLVAQARRVKQSRAALPVIIYLDAELAEPFQDSVRRAMGNSSQQDFFLRDQAGAPITCNVFCRSMGLSHTDPRCLAFYWNWFNQSAVDYYLNEYVRPIVAQPGFDGIFFDGADEWIKQAGHTWRVASNVPNNVTDALALKVLIDVRVRVTALLHANGKYPIISEHASDTTTAQQAYISSRMAGLGYSRYYEFWSPAALYIEEALNLTQRSSSPVPVFCRQLISRGLRLLDSIAAFLIVRGEYSYYSASTGWFDRDWQWHPEYDLTYGSPLGPATVSSEGVYQRRYTNCSVLVNWTAAAARDGNCEGTISFKA
mgnify:CR=1 FL=1